jgi:hypothetical protein
MQCDKCKELCSFTKLEDGSYICPNCNTNSHILDENGLCWCGPEHIELEGGNIWVHNRPN